MDIAGDYALAEEEEVAQGGSYVHGHKPDTKSESNDEKTKGQSRDRQKEEKTGGAGPKRAEVVTEPVGSEAGIATTLP